MVLKVCDTSCRSNETKVNFTGVVRKQLGLTFLGETRDDTRIVTGDICLKGVGLDRVVSQFSIRWKNVSDAVSKHWHRFGNFTDGGYV